jgi:hypothetical protein
MNLTDGIVIGKLDTCYTDESQNYKIRKISQGDDDPFPVENKKEDEKRKRGEGQPDLNE